MYCFIYNISYIFPHLVYLCGFIIILQNNFGSCSLKAADRWGKGTNRTPFCTSVFACVNASLSQF